MGDGRDILVLCEALERRSMLAGDAGELDRDYGVNGRRMFQRDRSTDFTGLSDAVLFRPDGRPLTVGRVSRGYGFLRQYETGGRLDASFGRGGLRNFDLFHIGFNLGARLQSDGKTLHLYRRTVPAAGSPRWSHLRCYRADGRLDPSFGGGDGEVILPYRGDKAWATAFTLQPDGSIRLFGTRYFNTPRGPRIAIVQAKLNGDGRLVRSFGDGGFVETRYPLPADDVELTVLSRPDGRIVAVAEGSNTILPRRRYSRVMLQFAADGSPDESFGDGGRVIVPESQAPSSPPTDVELAPDGSLLVATYNAIWRFDEEGRVDEDFGDDGRAGLLGVVELEVQADGRILVGIEREASGAFDEDVIVGRLTRSGERDRTFGREGFVRLDWGGDEHLVSLRLAGDGAVWVAGEKFLDVFSYRLVVARVLV